MRSSGVLASASWPSVTGGVGGAQATKLLLSISGSQRISPTWRSILLRQAQLQYQLFVLHGNFFEGLFGHVLPGAAVFIEGVNRHAGKELLNQRQHVLGHAV